MGWFEPPSADPPPEVPLPPPSDGRDYKGNPRPEDRADFVVKRLEQFIREGRTIAQGMSLKQWSEMARIEISNAIIDAENCTQKDDVVTKRWLFVCACAMVTVGFWGALLSFGKTDYFTVALVCVGAGKIGRAHV